MPRQRADSDPDEDVLEVIDLLTDEPVPITRTRRSDAEPETDRVPAPMRRRVLLIGAALLTAMLVGGIIMNARDDERAGVGLASDERSDDGDADAPRSDAAARALRAAPNEWRILDSRFALEVDGQPVVIDHMTGAIDAPRALPDGQTSVLTGQSGAYLLAVGGDAYIVGRDGSVVAGAGWDVFPASDGAGWWAAQGRTVNAIVGDAEPFATPVGFGAVAAVRDGFLLRSFDANALSLWSSGGEPRPIAPSDEVALVAVHPDRIAWHSRCPGDGCGLHVTEVVSGRDVVLPGVILPLFEAGRVHGRFSPDGRYLALHVSTNLAEPGSFALLDLTSGAIVARVNIGIAMPAPRAGSTLHSVPFDFTPDSEHVVVADQSSSRGALLVLRTADGANEHVLDRIAGVESVVALEREPTAPTTPLLAEGASAAPFSTGSTLALVGTAGDVLTVVDIDSGTQRVVELDYTAPTGDNDFQPRLVALDGGFAWIRDGEGWFAPTDAAPVSLGAATYIMPGGEPTVGWIVERADTGFAVTSFDGSTGARGSTYQTAAGPEGVVRAGLVIGRPASFTRGAELEVWNPETNDAQSISIDARYPVITSAGGTRVVWYDQSCAAESRTCGSRVTDITTERTEALPENAYPFSAAATTPAGDVLYLHAQDDSGSTRLTAVELATMSALDVPGSVGVEQWAASGRGVVVFQRNNAIYLWLPGWEDAALLSPGGFGIVGGVALR